MTRLSTYTANPTREKRSYNTALSDLLDRLFQEETTREGRYAALPPANIVETPKNYRIDLAVPGYEKSDFDLEIDKDLLTVSVKDEAPKDRQQKQSHRKVLRDEFGMRGFCRSFRLSDQVDPANIQAHYEKGILSITLPKSEQQMRRSITIS